MLNVLYQEFVPGVTKQDAIDYSYKDHQTACMVIYYSNTFLYKTIIVIK